MSSDITKATVLRRRNDVKWREEDFGLLLCNARGEYAVFNKVGQLIWEMLADPAPVDHLVRTVQARYPDVSPEVVEQDVLRFVESIFAKQLAEPASDA